MRVLKVMPGVDPCAGAEQSFALTAPGLIDRGVEMHLAVLTERQGLVPAFERAGGYTHDLSDCSSVVARYRALLEVIRKVAPDLVHATLWDAVVPSQLAARRSRVPLLVTWAGIGPWARGDTAGDAWKVRAVHLLDRAMARLSRCEFHAVTEGVARVNARGLRVPQSRVHVVERGRPDLDVPPDEELDLLRADLGLEPDERIVLCVGRHEAQKDHVTLVRAARLSVASMPEIRVLIAGRDGHATPAIRDVIRELDAGDFLALLGHRDDVPSLMAAADLFVLPSLHEGAAGAVIEAMRAGVPIIATDVVGQRGILENGTNSIVVPVSDPSALAAAMSRVLADPDLADRLGSAGRATFEQRFTLDRAVEGLESLYKQVVADGRT